MARHGKPKRDPFQDLMTILDIGTQAYGVWNQGQQFQQGRADTAAEGAAGRAHDLKLAGMEVDSRRDVADTRALHDLVTQGFERDPAAAPQYRAPQPRGQVSQFGEDPDANLRQPSAQSSPGYTVDPARHSTAGQERMGMWGKKSEQELLEGKNEYLAGQELQPGTYIDRSTGTIANSPGWYSDDEIGWADAKAAADLGLAAKRGGAGGGAEGGPTWDEYWDRYLEGQGLIEPRDQWSMGPRDGTYEDFRAGRLADIRTNLGPMPGGVEFEQANGTAMGFAGEILLGDEDNWAIYNSMGDGPIKELITKHLTQNNFNPGMFSAPTDGGGLGGLPDVVAAEGSIDSLRSEIQKLRQEQMTFGDRAEALADAESRLSAAESTVSSYQTPWLQQNIKNQFLSRFPR